MEAELYKKFVHQSINKYISDKVKSELIEKEQGYAHAPTLLAHPLDPPKNAVLD